MRIFVITICSLALATGAYSAEPEQNKQQKKKQPQRVQHAPAATAGHQTGAGAGPKKTSICAYQGKKGQTQMGAYEGQKGKKGQTQMGAYEGQKFKKGQTQMGAYEGQKGKKGQTSVEAYHGQKGKKGQTQMGPYQGQTGKVAKGGKVTGAGKPFKPQHFNLPTKTTPTKITAVNFQQGRHIQRSQ